MNNNVDMIQTQYAFAHEQRNQDLLSDLNRITNNRKELERHRNYAIISLVLFFFFYLNEHDWKFIGGSVVALLYSVIGYLNSSRKEMSYRGKPHNRRPVQVNFQQPLPIPSKTTEVSRTDNLVSRKKNSNRSPSTGSLEKPLTSPVSDRQYSPKPVACASNLIDNPDIDRSNYSALAANRLTSTIFDNRRTGSHLGSSTKDDLLRKTAFSASPSRSQTHLSPLNSSSTLAISSYATPPPVAAVSASRNSYSASYFGYSPMNISTNTGSTFGLSTGPSANYNNLREYQISPLNTKIILQQQSTITSGIEPKDALQTMGLTQISDEWVDELRAILGRHLFKIMDVYRQCKEEIRFCLQRALQIPVGNGGISPNDFHHAMSLLDHGDEERSEKLDNGHIVRLVDLFNYCEKIGMQTTLYDFQQRFEYAVSFFRLCLYIVHQKQHNITYLQELEVGGDVSTNIGGGGTGVTGTTGRRIDSKNIVIGRLEALLANSYDRKLNLHWNRGGGDSYSSTNFQDNKFYRPDNTSSGNILLTDQDIALALYLHRCDQIAFKYFGNATKNSNASASASLHRDMLDDELVNSKDANNFSRNHLIFNPTTDIPRMMRKLKKKPSTRNSSTPIDEEYNISFVYFSPGVQHLLQATANSSTGAAAGGLDFAGFSATGKSLSSFFTTGGQANLGQANNSSNYNMSSYDFIHAMKSPHFDILRLSSLPYPRKELFKVDINRTDTYEAILLYSLFYCFTLLVDYEINDQEFELIFHTNGNEVLSAVEGSSGNGDGEDSENVSELMSHSYFRVMKEILEKIISEEDLRFLWNRLRSSER